MKNGINREERMNELYDAASERLLAFLQSGDDVTSVDVAGARICSGVVSAWSRLQVAARARDAMNLHVAESLAGNKDELREYIRLAMPSNPLVRRLPGPKEKTALDEPAPG